MFSGRGASKCLGRSSPVSCPDRLHLPPVLFYRFYRPYLLSTNMFTMDIVQRKKIIGIQKSHQLLLV